MLQFILNLVLQNGLKFGGGYLMAHGWATSTQWQGVVGILTTLAGVLWDAYQKHQHAVLTGAIAPTLPNAGAKAASLIALLILPAALLTGCGGILPKDVAHVLNLTEDGTKVKIGQNSVSQMPELQVGRVQSDATIIPIIFQTNSASGQISAVVPDVVMSYEFNGRNSTFGGMCGTVTIATGTNAVQTILGGGHQPINAGTGTNLPK